MIQPPLEACRSRKWETAAVSFAMIVVVAIPLIVAVSAVCARASATHWLQSYSPIVYLEPGASTASAEKLVAELAEWPLVARVELREPQEAYATLSNRLGTDLVNELGVTAAMLPASIVIEPNVPMIGHVDLVSRVAGLEARSEVDAVQVPSTAAMDVIALAGAALVVAAVVSVLGLFAALVLLLGYLKRLRAADEEVDRVVALFGAYRSELARPTIVRGLAVAGACGVVLSAGGAVSLLGWQIWSPGLLGVATSPPIAAWSMVGAVALVMPLLGLLAGWGASRAPVRIWRGTHA